MIEIKRAPDREKFVFEARCQGEKTAEISGDIKDGVFTIEEYDGEADLFDGMCRSILNGADHSGAVSAVFGENIDRKLMKRWGFKERIDSIAEFFDGKSETES